jgi:predicted metalloprotease with PDZ domain
VKRIRPAAFVAPDLGRENYTRLLWLFEGFTAYYDELWLARAGVISEACYLERLGKTLTQVAQTPGRHRQSLAEASFDAWIKYYRPDENSANATVSYYSKGALVALCLDLALRRQSDGRLCLDDLMRRLWRDAGIRQRGLGETEIFTLVAELGGKALARWLRQAVEGTDDLPLARALAWVGVHLDWQADGDTPWIGAQWAEKAGNSGGGTGEVRLTQVRNDAPAERAGLAAGDLLVALDGERLTRDNFAAMLARARPGVARLCHYFRHERLMETELVPAEAPRETARLRLGGGAAAKARRAAWLSGG